MIVTYDSVTAVNIPAGSYSLSYANGRYANTTAISQRAIVVGQVDVLNAAPGPHVWLDIENGDAVAADAPGFMARGGQGLYTSQSNWPAVINALIAGGINPTTVPFWIASYQSSVQPTTLPTVVVNGVKYTAAGHQYWDDGAKDISVWADNAPLALPVTVAPAVVQQPPIATVKVKPRMNLVPSNTTCVDYLTNGATTVLCWADGSTWLVRSGFSAGAITSALDARLNEAFKGRVAATLTAFGKYGFTITATSGETYHFGS